MIINNAHVNQLAISFSSTDDSRTFTALIKELKGAITVRAQEYSRFTKTSREDFESILTLAVWECLHGGQVTNHDTAKTQIMQRISQYWKYSLQRQQQSEYRESRRVHLKAESIETALNPEQNPDVASWTELLPDPREDFAKAYEVRDLVERYSVVNPKEYPVISALLDGANGNELAALMGYPEHSAPSRMQLQRVRKRFSRYMNAALSA